MSEDWRAEWAELVGRTQQSRAQWPGLKDHGILAADEALRELEIVAEGRNEVAYLARALEAAETERDDWREQLKAAESEVERLKAAESERDMLRASLVDEQERRGLQTDLTGIWQERAQQLEQHIIAQGGESPPMPQDDGSIPPGRMWR